MSETPVTDLGPLAGIASLVGLVLRGKPDIDLPPLVGEGIERLANIVKRRSARPPKE